MNWPILETFNLYVIFNDAILLPERFSLYGTESMNEARQRKQQLAYFGPCILGHVLISKPHTKSSNALDYMTDIV